MHTFCQVITIPVCITHVMSITMTLWSLYIQHVCAGSVYCDPSLRGIGFNGEGVSSSAVLAVKTHETLKPFQVATYS